MPRDLDRGAGREPNQEQPTDNGNFAEEKKISSRNLARDLDNELPATGKKVSEPAREQSQANQNHPPEGTLRLRGRKFLHHLRREAAVIDIGRFFAQSRIQPIFL
jgi:hypothetical protein